MDTIFDLLRLQMQRKYDFMTEAIERLSQLNSALTGRVLPEEDWRLNVEEGTEIGQANIIHVSRRQWKSTPNNEREAIMRLLSKEWNVLVDDGIISYIEMTEGWRVSITW